MTSTTISAAGRPDAALVVTAGAAVLALAVGLRIAQGVFVVPLSADFGWPLVTFSTALAVQNLLWGVMQPAIGLFADVVGAGRVVAVGALLFAAGLALTALADTPLTITLATGVVLAAGLAAVSFPVVMAVVARAVTPERRSIALGLAIAGGSVGQVFLPPLSGRLVSGEGTGGALLILGAAGLAMVPLAWFLREPKRVGQAAPPRLDSIGPTLRFAWAQKGYRLAVAGFFACGFQLAFLASHLPGHLSLCGLSAHAGADALGLMGLFNIFGCWAAGAAGVRWPAPRLLAGLYLARALAVAGFMAVPVTDVSVFAFSAVTGLTWLATVPLTGNVVARMFGPQSLGLLFGFAFFSHQVGSCLGALIGGAVLDLTGSYDFAWVLSGLLALVAVFLHLPIDDRPVTAVDGGRPNLTL